MCARKSMMAHVPHTCMCDTMGSAVTDTQLTWGTHITANLLCCSRAAKRLVCAWRHAAAAGLPLRVLLLAGGCAGARHGGSSRVHLAHQPQGVGHERQCSRGRHCAAGPGGPWPAVLTAVERRCHATLCLQQQLGFLPGVWYHDLLLSVCQSSGYPHDIADP